MMFVTLGHSNRSLAAFVALLREAGTEVLADVRRWPRSRRNPQFNAESLAAALRPLGVEYRHVESLGGRRQPEPAMAPEENGLWREPGFRNFAAYANTEPFRVALQQLVRWAGSRDCALMCAEAMWWQCHRRIIADHLLIAGHSVAHVLAPGRRETAVLTPQACPQPDGRILYPAAPTLL